MNDDTLDYKLVSETISWNMFSSATRNISESQNFVSISRAQILQRLFFPNFFQHLYDIIKIRTNFLLTNLSFYTIMKFQDIIFIANILFSPKLEFEYQHSTKRKH